MGRFQEGKDGTGLSPHLRQLRPHHRSMARAVALGSRRPSELSEVYSMTPGQVSRIMGSPAFQAEVRRLEEENDIVCHDMAKDLQLMAQTAIENLDEDLHLNPISLEARRLRNSASLEILGMVGVRRTGGNTTNILNLTTSQAEKDVAELGEQEIREEIMELLEGPDGAYQ